MKRVLLQSRSGYWAIVIGLTLLLIGCTPALIEQEAADPEPQSKLVEFAQLEPNPDLSPEEVVKIQVEALQNNDRRDRGIEITFRFASPSNKQMTGPLNRFKRMVRNPLYQPMLNHQSAKYSPIKIEGNSAVQRVIITGSDGKSLIYIFELSRQSGSACPGCWMTDSVTVAPPQPQKLDEA